jgi:hypothetical protein
VLFQAAKGAPPLMVYFVAESNGIRRL